MMTVPEALVLRGFELNDLLRERAYSTRELAERFEVSQRTVQRYIRVLREAGQLDIQEDMGELRYRRKHRG